MQQNIKAYNEDSSNNEFAALLQEDLDKRVTKESSLVDAIVTKIEEKIILCDIGLKSEATINKSELTSEEIENLKIGDKLELFIERLESKHGEVIASHEKAKRVKSWNRIQKAFDDQTKVTGTIKSSVKGGFSCEIFGIQAFVPSSQLADAPIRNPNDFINKPLEFLIIKIDNIRMNVIASRRVLLEESKNISKDEVLAKFKVGDVVKGKIKAIQSYGAFISVESLDCLLHTSEISHLRVSSPEEIFTIGEEVTAQILEIDNTQKRMSLSIKAMTPDPYIGVENKYKVGEVYEVKISKLTDFGAFAELDAGIAGLIHTSEIKHLKKNVNPRTVFKVGDVVKVKLKELDLEKKKIILSYKDTQENPIEDFKKRYPINSIVEAKIVNKKDFGLFVNTDDTEIDIFIHYKQLDYSESSNALNSYKKGDSVKFKIIDIKDDKVNGSVRALLEDPFDVFKGKKKGDIVTAKVAEILDNYIRVNVGEKRFPIIIKKAEIAVEKADQRTNRFAVGDALDAMIIQLDKKERKIELSVKKLEEKQTKEAIAKYKNIDSGSQLADILGPALKAEKKPKKSKKDNKEE
ncbi:MAG: S1 RNA-binding domain-containing protein [Candidatus Fonsibacter sp.]|nr:S1 RNA-binding domain-containing protein [Candidatus Fonsibacter sp.]